MRKMKLLVLTLLLCTIITLPGYAEDPVSVEDFWAAAAAAGLPGAVYGEGTVFEVTDSEYLNVTVTSTETVKLRVESTPKAVTIETIPSTLVSSTFLTVSGLEPGKVYYMYLDVLENYQEITADATGVITFLHDMTSEHFVIILPNHSTYGIRDNATGGDCEGRGIGTWTPETKTCTLTTDLFESIYLVDAGLTLDGDGHTIQAPGSLSQWGVFGTNVNGLTVRNVTVLGFWYGIEFRKGGGHTIENVTVDAKYVAITLYRGTGTNAVTGSTLYASTDGVYYATKAYLILDGNAIFGTAHLQYPGAKINGLGLYIGATCGTITNNVFDHWKSAVALISIRKCTPLEDFRPGTEPDAAVIMNNLLTNNETGISGSDSNGVSLIWNNTIAQSLKYGYAASQGSRTVLHSNNFLDNAQSIFIDFQAYGHSIDKNYYSEYDSPEEGCIDNGPNGYPNGDPDGYCDEPYEFPELNLDGTYKTDYYPRTTPVSGTLPDWLNAPPTADAGDDFSAECTSPSGAVVPLDGTGSSDPDGDTLTYSWTAEDGTVVGTEAITTVSLPLGIHTFTLTVDDGNGETSTDSVTVTVADTIAPVITITGITDSATYEFGLVPIAGYEVTDVCSMTVQAADSLTGGDGLGLGLFTYTVTATDESGNTATESAAYEVIATQAGLTVYINDLVTSGIIPANTGNNLLNMLNNADLGALINRLEALYNYLTAPGQAEEDQIPLEVVDVLINAVHYMIDNQ